MPLIDMLSMELESLSLNIRVLRNLLRLSLSARERFLPSILTIPLMLGMMMLIEVSIEAVAAISQSSSPLKAWSIGIMLSTAGKRLMTFSAVTLDRVKSKPAFRSSFVLPE